MTAEIYQVVPLKFMREKADISSRSGRMPPEQERQHLERGSWRDCLEEIDREMTWFQEQNPEQLTIRSRDGLKLCGSYLEAPNAKACMLLCHGYRSRGGLDFALVLSDRYSPDLVEHEFLQDHIYLCVPENLLRAYYTPEEVRERKIQAVQGVELRDFDRLPFALMTNRLGARIQEIFTREHIQPNVFFTAPSTAQTLPMCTKGLAACYCTHMNLVEKRGTVDANVNIFPLYDQGVPLVQKLSLLRHKQRYLTHFAKYFMDLTFQVAASIEKTPVRWIVQQPAVEKSVENV